MSLLLARLAPGQQMTRPQRRLSESFNQATALLLVPLAGTKEPVIIFITKKPQHQASLVMSYVVWVKTGQVMAWKSLRALTRGLGAAARPCLCSRRRQRPCALSKVTGSVLRHTSLLPKPPSGFGFFFGLSAVPCYVTYCNKINQIETK